MPILQAFVCEKSVGWWIKLILLFSLLFCVFPYTPPHDSGLWFHVWPSVCLSVLLSYIRLSVRIFCFWTITSVAPNLVEILLWVVIGQISSICDMSDNIDRFSPLGMCIDFVEIWFWIANGQVSSF